MMYKGKHVIGIAAAMIALSGCHRLDTIDYAARVRPDAFLAAQYWTTMQIAGHSFILCQPTSTIIVFFAGLFAIYTGYRFLSDMQHERSMLLWGLGLCLTGVGALCAGVSFQSFSYEIKCAGREYCTYTSWWEVAYMLLSVPGMNAFLSASAYTNARGSFRRAIITYAVIHSVAYVALLLYGALMPVQFFVSFDLFVLVSAPSVLFLIVLHARAYLRSRDQMDQYLLSAWLIFAAASAAYFIYLQYGIAQRLWRHGTWFSENDVLHTGMIIWIYYLLTRVRDEVHDVV